MLPSLCHVNEPLPRHRAFATPPSLANPPSLSLRTEQMPPHGTSVTPACLFHLRSQHLRLLPDLPSSSALPIFVFSPTQLRPPTSPPSSPTQPASVRHPNHLLINPPQSSGRAKPISVPSPCTTLPCPSSHPTDLHTGRSSGSSLLKP